METDHRTLTAARPADRSSRAWPGAELAVADWSLRSRRPTKLALPVGWPLTTLLAGYPIWWLIGVAELLPLIAAAVMAGQLIKLRTVKVQAGFGWWLLYLAWVAVGVLLVQVDAPHAIAGQSSTRYVTFAFRVGWYLSATVTALYVYNLRQQLSTTRVLRAFSWLFVTVVVGGVAGTLAPSLDFPSVLDLLLPHRLANVQYVHDLIHPIMAQRYSVNGVVKPRASAPFAYTNDWGLNYALLLPFFLYAWFRPDAGWRRRVAPLILIASIYPVLLTGNRAMWIALLVVAVLFALRSALFGHAQLLVRLLALVAVLAVVLVTTPLGNNVEARFANGYSNNGRTNLGRLSVESVLGKSPVAGLGTTRNVQGSFYSIAGGDTAACAQCSPPALGTQGHFWLVVFSTGVGGLIMYLAFIGQQFVRALRRNSPVATLAMAVLAAHLVTMFFYDTIGVALLAIFAAIGLLWRDYAEPGTNARPADRRASGYLSLLRTNAAVVTACLLAGLVGGLLFSHQRPHRYTAETNLTVPVASTFAGTIQVSQSLDSVAGLIGAVQVDRAVSSALGRTVDDAQRLLSVTATPNSRVLHIDYSDTDPVRAERVSLAAAQALDQLRVTLLSQLQAQALVSLQAVRDSLQQAVDHINSLGQAGLSPGSILADSRTALTARLEANLATTGQVEASQVNVGTISENKTVARQSSGRLVAGCSGVLLGLLLAVVIAFVRDAIGPRVGARQRAATVAGLRVLDRLERDRRGPQAPLARTVGVLDSMRATLVVSTDDDATTRSASAFLTGALMGTGGRARTERVVLLAGPRTRVRAIGALRADLDQRGALVLGLVVGDQYVGRRNPRGAAVTPP